MWCHVICHTHDMLLCNFLCLNAGIIFSSLLKHHMYYMPYWLTMIKSRNQNYSYNFIFLFSGFDAAYKSKMAKGRRGEMAHRTVSLHSKDLILLLFTPLSLAATPKLATLSPPSTYAMLGRQAFLNMHFKHTTYYEFSRLVSEESEEQSGETTCQFTEIC